ncbi:MAG: hypothetical protein WBZ36_16155 [Candidatus Nitrosopolaris sp.]
MSHCQLSKPDLLKARLGHGVSDSDSSKVLTPKENHNPVTNNHYNSSIISEQQNVKQKNVNNTTEKNEIASAIRHGHQRLSPILIAIIKTKATGQNIRLSILPKI